MNEIVYLIDQAERSFEKKQYEIGAEYNLDAWLTLKQHLKDNKIVKVQDINFKSKKDTDFIKKWVSEFHIHANEEFQFKTNIEILTSMLDYFDFTSEETIIKNRAICDTYYYLNEYETCDNLYEELINKNQSIMEYYYGYALTLYDREEYSKAISILEEGIDKSIDKLDTYILLGFEVILQIYDELDEPENIEKIKKEINKIKSLA